MAAKTVAEVIAELQKLPQDLPMYFDCPRCGRANIFSTTRMSAVVETTSKEENQSNGLQSR